MNLPGKIATLALTLETLTYLLTGCRVPLYDVCLKTSP